MYILSYTNKFRLYEARVRYTLLYERKIFIYLLMFTYVLCALTCTSRVGQDDALGCISEITSDQGFLSLTTELQQRLFDCACSLLPLVANHNECPSHTTIARLLQVVTQLMPGGSSDFISRVSVRMMLIVFKVGEVKLKERLDLMTAGAICFRIQSTALLLFSLLTIVIM